MTDKEAMAMALDALNSMKETLAEHEEPTTFNEDEAITAIKEALAQEKALQALHDENERLGLYKDAYGQPEQEPVAWWNNTGTHIDLNVSGRGTPLYTHPPQRVEQKTVMWPCLIDTADFSKGTITVVMQCEDYKVSAGTHWLSTTPPQRTEPVIDKSAAKRIATVLGWTPPRTWVGLTDEEREDIALEVPIDAVLITEAKLKEKNT